MNSTNSPISFLILKFKFSKKPFDNCLNLGVVYSFENLSAGIISSTLDGLPFKRFSVVFNSFKCKYKSTLLIGFYPVYVPALNRLFSNPNIVAKFIDIASTFTVVGIIKVTNKVSGFILAVMFIGLNILFEKVWKL